MVEHEIGTASMSTPHASPLQGRKIRLLQLHPGRLNALLEGKTVEASLDDPECPKYEALSYVRDDPDITEPMLCNGEPIRITVNLAKALRRIRRGILPPRAVPMRPFEVVCGDQLSLPSHIWIDAICMDQSDQAERDHQDSLMGEIYTKAERVIVWLHEHDMSKEMLATALTALDVVFSNVDRSGPQTLTFAELGKTIREDVRLRTKLNVWEATDKMFSSQWFNCVEYVQEVNLAQDVSILYSVVQLATESVIVFLRWYQDRVCHETESPASPRLLRNLRQLDRRRLEQYGTVV